MISSGIRVRAWDYLKWGNIVPLIRNEKISCRQDDCLRWGMVLTHSN